MPHEFIDALPSWVVLALTVLLLALAAELGFQSATRWTPWLAQRAGRAAWTPAESSDRRSHVNVVLTALLGLLGLLLAFSFGIVEERYQQRKKLVLEEANAIGTTYLRAAMLPAPHNQAVSELLRKYVKARVGIKSPEELLEGLRKSETIQQKLWAEAKQATSNYPQSIPVGLFVVSLNDVIDMHESRVTVALYNRLPEAIILALFTVSLLALALLGYNAGLTQSRGIVATFAVLIAIAVVIMLIIELDRPMQRLFHVNNQAMVDTLESMQ